MNFGAWSNPKVMERILRDEGATMWVNDDKAQSESLPHAPQWIG
jgi:hypothetical protein